MDVINILDIAKRLRFIIYQLKSIYSIDFRSITLEQYKILGDTFKSSLTQIVYDYLELSYFHKIIICSLINKRYKMIELFSSNILDLIERSNPIYQQTILEVLVKALNDPNTNETIVGKDKRSISNWLDSILES